MNLSPRSVCAFYDARFLRVVSAVVLVFVGSACLSVPVVGERGGEPKAGSEQAAKASESPRSRLDPARYTAQIAAFAEKEAEVGGILFTGSSQIRRWKTLEKDFPGLPVLNRGFGGSTVHDLIAHFAVVVERHAPRLLVVYTGSNDINSGLTPDEVFSDYVEFLELVRAKLPMTRVILNPLKMSEKRIEQTTSAMEVNRRLEAWSQSQDWVRYVDTGSYLLDEHGQPLPRYFVADKLHLNAAGYAEWLNYLDPVVREEWARVQ